MLLWGRYKKTGKVACMRGEWRRGGNTVNIRQQQPPKKRKLGTLSDEECDCSIFAAMEVLGGG